MTFDLGRVTTIENVISMIEINCGDVRSRTSYNFTSFSENTKAKIAVTFDLGRVTTKIHIK